MSQIYSRSLDHQKCRKLPWKAAKCRKSNHAKNCRNQCRKKVFSSHIMCEYNLKLFRFSPISSSQHSVFRSPKIAWNFRLWNTKGPIEILWFRNWILLSSTHISKFAFACQTKHILHLFTERHFLETCFKIHLYLRFSFTF